MQGGWGAMGAGAWGSNQRAPPLEEDEVSPKLATTLPVASAPPNPAASAFTSSSAAGGAYPGAYSSGMPASAGVPAAVASGSVDPGLRTKEAELKKKEAELRKLENELKAAGGFKKKNFPICFPMWHHDISGDIPEKSRRVVREMFVCWWGLVFCLSYQVFCASVMLGYNVNNKIPSWFLSLIYWLTGVPLSMYLWYKRIYGAARDDSTIGMWTFFLFFFCHCAFCIWCAIAIPFGTEAWSFCGFGAAMSAFGVNNFTGTIYIIGACFWTIESLWCLWCLKDAYMFNKSGGFTAAKKEATQDAAVKAFSSNMAAGNANRV